MSDNLKQKLAQISKQLYYWKGHEWVIHRPDDKTLLKQHLEVTPVLLAVIDKLIEQREVYAERAGDQENYDSDNAELLEILERGK